MTEDKLFAARGADFAWCEAVIQAHSPSFYTAFSLLGGEKSQSVYAIYAFCRMADDCVDIDQSHTKLLALRKELDSFTAGHVPNAPVWRALAAVFERFDMDSRPFYDMLAGQEKDLLFRQPETGVDLEEYCYYVAGSVGLMLLPVLCAESGTGGRLRHSAIALGTAMQLTNLLRDVGEDLARGRVYLPKALMRRLGYTRAQLEAHEVNPAFIALWETLARRAEALYGEMERDLPLLDTDSRLPTLTSLYLYRGILDAVRAAGHDCFGHRGYVETDEKQRLAAKAQSALAPTLAQTGMLEEAL